LLKLWLLSYKPYNPLGSPTWDYSEKQISNQTNIPFLTGITALPRQLWLEEPGEIDSCVKCGQIKPLIRKLYSACVKISDTNFNWQDPHVIYKQDLKTLKTEDPMKEWFKTDRPWKKL